MSSVTAQGPSSQWQGPELQWKQGACTGHDGMVLLRQYKLWCVCRSCASIPPWSSMLPCVAPRISRSVHYSGIDPSNINLKLCCGDSAGDQSPTIDSPHKALSSTFPSRNSFLDSPLLSRRAACPNSQRSATLRPKKSLTTTSNRLQPPTTGSKLVGVIQCIAKLWCFPMTAP